MKKITYLFGAGASKNVLPITDEIPERLRFLAEVMKLNKEGLNEHEIFSEIRLEIPKKTIYTYFINDLIWLSENAKLHASVDTFAKKLYIKQEFDTLKKLRITLSMFLILEQSINGLDDRYDSFFASILSDSHINLPNNLKILSWNYDYQLEKAYSIYSGDNRLSATHSMLNVFTKNIRSSRGIKDFSVFKINGTAGLVFDGSTGKQLQLLDEISTTNSQKFLDKAIECYALMHHHPDPASKITSSLSFAWENDILDKNIITEAVDATKDTDILVVIGYSFPFFNREIDRKIIRGMKRLEKVYFQAPDANDIKERFLAIRDDISDDMLLCKYDIKQFVFPNEF